MRSLALGKRGIAASVAAAAIAASVHTGVAHAGIEPLPIASYSPINGAVIPARPTGFGASSWSLTSIPLLQGVWVLVTRTPATGTDGLHLSDTDLEQFCELHASATDVGVYQVNGCTNQQGLWTTVPGTYYWQIRAAWNQYVGSELVFREYLSPIFAIGVAYPTPPPVVEPPPMETPPQTAPRPSCNGKYATIGGHGTCLHSGAPCSQRYNRQYSRYHYACVRRGRHYRLVRR
jgi:hypothetical protein